MTLTPKSKSLLFTAPSQNKRRDEDGNVEVGANAMYGTRSARLKKTVDAQYRQPYKCMPVARV